MQNALLTDPLKEIDVLFQRCDRDPEQTKQAVLTLFRDRLDCSTKDLLKVPLLDEIFGDQRKSERLVRFRCMIQDMYDPEYFIPTFRKDNMIVTSLFRDPLDGNFFEDSISSMQPMERSSWHCIAIPAENEWVINGYSTSVKTSTKVDTGIAAEGLDQEVPAKKKKSGDLTESIQGVSESNELTRTCCFPLPTHQRSCIVKVYSGDNENMRLNDVIEVVGVLSHIPERSDEASGTFDSGLSGEEFDFKNPPTSLIPRIHAVFIKKIVHQNPLLGYHIEEENAIVRRRILEEAPKWRHELLSILKQIFLGDEHTAEYVLLHLISRVYVRHDVLPLGMFSLNIRNAGAEQAKLLAKLISHLVTKSCMVSMSLDFLNGTKFIPSKDYDLNRLQSGLLQLSEGTHLICDENALDAGQLSAVGVDNVKALGNMIQHQTVQYNFGFHQMEFTTDVPVLYISHGKGLIRCNFQVKVQPVLSKDRLSEVVPALETLCLNDELLNELRRYITIAKLSEQKMTEEMQQTVQDDFVAMRATNSMMTADDLHNLLVVARYVSLSRGELEMSLDAWNYAKVLEAERLLRCS